MRVDHGPIVKDPKWTVRCACGFAYDSAAETGDDAIREIEAMHHDGLALIAYEIRR